ncbi:3-hydroxyacyl-CoA dehydrogenase [Oceanibaculum pacificum]|uniref:3-hydroxyacyl-CoA dehydrogenase n=1 Tax=Oceanibaculum pacificum TaxID=580166 RepID=A0A154VQF3_9PROT|nr:3-hydroxyacyl-CoA dehydrogenase [Oceanibaculum pacificum]KZD03516.1 3-hydroxyacyl-CoA dehydrogenase [Oceanibaculum pacificum]
MSGGTKDAVAVIGAGLIGWAWAICFARAGHAVKLYDVSQPALEAALGLIETALHDLRDNGLLDDPAAAQARISTAATLEEALAGVAYVQENVRETVEAKQEIFAALDRIADPAAILASSSSNIRASLFTETLPGRARCLVAHPANPPHLVPIVELSPAPWTDPAVVDRARALHDAAGMSAILVRREVPGFILNRLQGALLAEAFKLVADGYASAEDVDKTIKDGLGLRWAFMGPFETIDLNAPGGIADYIDRYAPMYWDMQEMQATPRRWDEPLRDALESERRDALPADRLGDRQAWRDRRLMALLAHKRAAAKEIGE